MKLWFILGSNLVSLFVITLFVWKNWNTIRAWFKQGFVDKPSKIGRLLNLTVKALLVYNIAAVLLMMNFDDLVKLSASIDTRQTVQTVNPLETTMTTTKTTSNTTTKNSTLSSDPKPNSQGKPETTKVETNEKTMTTQEDYKKLLFTKPNLIALAVICYLMIAVVICFVLYLPFVRISELNIFGNSVKFFEEKLAENVEISDKAVEMSRKVNFIHTRILASIVDDLIDIESCFVRGKFSDPIALQRLAVIINRGYKNEQLHVTAGFIEVEKDEAKELEDFKDHAVKKTIKRAIQLRRAEKGDSEVPSSLVVPINNSGSDYYLLYLSSTDVKLSDNDGEMILTAWKIIENQALHKLNLDKPA